MSASPGVIQALLAQKLMQPSPPAQPYGGGGAGPQMQPRTGLLQGAGDMASKLMLMRALQGLHPGQPPGDAAGAANPLADPNYLGSMQIQPQVPNAQPMPQNPMSGGVAPYA